MRMVGHLEGHFIKADCYVCGGGFDLGCSGDGEGNYGISYDLYADAGEHLGCVCYDCIKLPAETINARLGTEEPITMEWIPELDISTGKAREAELEAEIEDDDDETDGEEHEW